MNPGLRALDTVRPGSGTYGRLGPVPDPTDSRSQSDVERAPQAKYRCSLWLRILFIRPSLLILVHSKVRIALSRHVHWFITLHYVDPAPEEGLRCCMHCTGTIGLNVRGSCTAARWVVSR